MLVSKGSFIVLATAVFSERRRVQSECLCVPQKWKRRVRMVKVSMCVCVREVRKSERESVRVCVCVCERERERERNCDAIRIFNFFVVTLIQLWQSPFFVERHFPSDKKSTFC